MEKSAFWWNFLALLIAIFVKAKCESTAFPVIPSHLLGCYMDDGIYHRANRMPNSFEYFLDLVKKVEGSTTSRNTNARELALILLHYLKLDGIQSIRSSTKFYPSNILPYAPSGAQYFKHRLTLVGLVPRIDQSYITAFNETLTKKEMCNLHFMLSYSIDPYKREDEKCSPLFEESKKWMEEAQRSQWDPYQNIHDYYRRHKRYINREENLNELFVTRSTALSGKSSKESDKKKLNELKHKQNQDRLKMISKTLTSREMKEKESLENYSKKHLDRKKRNMQPEKDKKLEVEQIFLQQNHQIPKEYLPYPEKDKFTIGGLELLSPGEHRADVGMQSVIQMGSFGKYGGRVHTRLGQSTDENLYSGVIPEIPLSDCPVVNGVVTTPFGSLTIGTVIAGIAAGLNPEEIPPTKLSVDPSELESLSDRVKNIWATTLAGTVADTISSSALLDMDNLQILKGGWNDSSDAKWYLLANNQFKHMTEVALRGSLDGLLLGINAKEWTRKFPDFKLSQMLQTYYDSCWETIGAKYRVQLRSKYAPEDIFRKQVHLMSLVLKKQKTNVLTVLDYSQIAREAVGKVIQHIQTMDDKEKSYIGSFLPTKIDNTANMIAVVDSSWGHENLYQIFRILRQAQVINTAGSNLTIICGKDGKVLTTSKNSVDFHAYFTKDMVQDNCTRGMDLPLIFDTLDTMYRQIYYNEKTSQNMNTDSQVAVLFPFEPITHESNYVTEKSKNFRSSFPDVRLMIASNGRPESFLPLLNSSKDLFTLVFYPADSSFKSLEEFANGVKQSYQRISRPSCGSYFDDETPGTETHVVRDVGLGNIAYYRLLPQYFYTQHGQVTIRIKPKLGASLTICHSREMERPALPTPRSESGSNQNYRRNHYLSPDFPNETSDPQGRHVNSEADSPVQCKTVTLDSYEIEMNNPCEGSANLHECQPLYISLSPPLPETVTVLCKTCRLPTNVQYEISVTGLTCYNRVATMSVSAFLILFLLIHYSFTLILNH